MVEKDHICSSCYEPIDLSSENICRVDITVTVAPYATNFDDISAEEAGRQLRDIINELEKTSTNEANHGVVRSVAHYLCKGCGKDFEDNPFKKV